MVMVMKMPSGDSDGDGGGGGDDGPGKCPGLILHPFSVSTGQTSVAQ